MFYSPNELNSLTEHIDEVVYSRNGKNYVKTYDQDINFDVVEGEIEVYKTKSEAYGQMLSNVISHITTMERIREEIRNKYNKALKNKE